MISNSSFVKSFFLIFGLVFLLILLSIQSIKAQKLIPRIGLTYAKTSLSKDDTQYHYKEVKFKQGFLAGVALELPIKDNYSFQTELVYVQKGQEASETGKIGTFYFHSRTYSLEFLEMPLLFKAAFKKGKVIFYPQLGVSVGYGLGGKAKSVLIQEDNQGNRLTGTSDGKVRFEKYKDGYPNDIFLETPFDIGLQVGVGVLLFDKVILDLRYTRGLTDFPYYYYEESYNKVFQLSIGLPLELRK